jgi:transposase-like protein
MKITPLWKICCGSVREWKVGLALQSAYGNRSVRVNRSPKEYPKQGSSKLQKRLLAPSLRYKSRYGYIPFFVTERKRSEAAIIQVVQETYISGVSTRKIEKLAQALGIENMSRRQVRALNKDLTHKQKRSVTVLWKIRIRCYG